MQTQNGFVSGVEMIPKVERAYVVLEKGRVVDVNDFHKLMGHINEESLRKTADYYGIKLKGNCETCYECSISKIRQKNVKKQTQNKSSIPGERLFIDISHVRAQSFGGSKYWILIVDDCTDKCWSIFVDQKSKMPEKVIELIKKLRSDQQYPITHIVKKIRCDDAGENKMLEKKCSD
jgi:hypothetical protein